MENNTIEFSTGNLKIERNSLSFYNKNVRLKEVSTILRENIGHVIKEPIKVLPNPEMIHCSQIAALGFIFSVIGVLIGMEIDTYFLLYLGIGLIYLSVFLLFSNLWLDSIIGSKIATPLLYALFGVDSYKVVVQNIYGGNNLIFFIKKNEIARLPNIQNYKKYKNYKLSTVTVRPFSKKCFID
jgi:hypothetical protein